MGGNYPSAPGVGWCCAADVFIIKTSINKQEEKGARHKKADAHARPRPLLCPRPCCWFSSNTQTVVGCWWRGDKTTVLQKRSEKKSCDPVEMRSSPPPSLSPTPSLPLSLSVLCRGYFLFCFLVFFSLFLIVSPVRVLPICNQNHSSSFLRRGRSQKPRMLI